MSILDYIEKMKDMYESPRITGQEPRTMDQAALVDELEPGALKDELLKDFDPSQETHEEYLQRKSLERPFNMAEGGRIGFATGSPGVDMQEILNAYKEYKRSHHKGKRRSPIIPFRKFFEIYAAENMAEGGRIGFSEGLSAKAEAMKKLDAAKVANPSKEVMDEISTIVDKYTKTSDVAGKKVKHLSKDGPIDKIFKEVKTTGYKRPSVAKELFKQVLKSKGLTTYDNYRTNKIVFTLTDVLSKNKGDILSIKPSAVAEILPEFAIEGVKGGKGAPIFKTFINYLKGSERLSERSGLQASKQIGGKSVNEIITQAKNLMEIPGARARGNFTVFEEAKLLDRLANENAALKPSQLEKLYKENGGTNFKQRLKDLLPAKTGQSIRGSDRGKSILEAVKRGEISNSLPKSLRSAYAFYTKDYNWSRLIRQAELFRKDNPELAYRFIKGSDIFRKANLERLGITGVVGEHALPISAIKTANADIDTFLKIDAFVDRELNNWKAKNFDEAIFAPNGLADKYKKAKGADKIKIKNEIIERLNYMKKKAPELMKNVSFDFTNGIFTAKSSTPAIDTLSDDAIKALATKGSDIKTTFIKNAGDTVELTDTGAIKTIKESFIKPKPVTLGANLANIDAIPKNVQKILGNFWCGTRKAYGGRIGFANGSGCPDSVKQRNFIALNNDVREGRITGEAAEQIKKQTKNVVAKAGSRSALTKLLGPAGIGLDILYEAGSIGTDIYGGTPWREAVQDNWIAGALMPGTSQEEFHKAFFKKHPEAKTYGSGLDLEQAFLKKQKQIERLKVSDTYRGKAEAAQQLPQLERDLEGIAAQYNALGNAMVPGSPEYEAYMAAKTEYLDARKATSPATAAKLKMELDPIESDRFKSYEESSPVKMDFSFPGNYTTFRPDLPPQLGGTLPTKREIDELYTKEGYDLSPQDIDYVQKLEKWNQLFYDPENKGMGIRGTQDWRGAGGGMVGIRKPSAIPPESGPQSQGLASLKKYGSYY